MRDSFPSDSHLDGDSVPNVHLRSRSACGHTTHSTRADDDYILMPSPSVPSLPYRICRNVNYQRRGDSRQSLLLHVSPTTDNHDYEVRYPSMCSMHPWQWERVPAMYPNLLPRPWAYSDFHKSTTGNRYPNSSPIPNRRA